MKGDTLIVMARAPRLGTVKRRLAAGIGPVPALRFYRVELGRLLRRVGRDRRWRTVLAVTPDRAAARWPRAITRVAQGRGDLGQRMGRALGRHRRALLIGSDIPGLAAADIAAGFRALGAGAGAVFGPAEDGGYWLVGLGPRRPSRPFAAVRWSTATALADTLANCVRHRVALLRPLADIDTAADLAALAAGPRGRAGGGRDARPIGSGGRGWRWLAEPACGVRAAHQHAGDEFQRIVPGSTPQTGPASIASGAVDGPISTAIGTRRASPGRRRDHR